MPYEPKNVLITGGAGFIASHVAILFAKKYPHCKVSKEAIFFFFFVVVVVDVVVVCAVFIIFFCGRQRSSVVSPFASFVLRQTGSIRFFTAMMMMCVSFSLFLSFSLSFFGWNTTDNLLNFTSSSSSSSSCSFIRSSFSISSIIAPT